MILANNSALGPRSSLAQWLADNYGCLTRPKFNGKGLSNPSCLIFTGDVGKGLVLRSAPAIEVCWDAFIKQDPSAETKVVTPGSWFFDIF